MKKSIYIISAFLLAASSVFAQDARQWTLQECIQYALDHNIQVKQQVNTTRQQKIQLDDNKGNHLPTVDASVGQNFSFGRGLTAQNTYENTNTSRTSFELGASVPLFVGGKIVNAVKLSQLNLDASLADLERAQDDIRTQVAKAYVQILYDMEVSDVAKRQIAIDSMQVYRLERMMEAGKASQAEVSQQKATLAQSRLTATNADNNYRLSLLALSQLLELPTPEGFSIVKPDVAAITPLNGNEGSIVAPDVIYAEALGVKPQVKAEQLRLKATDFNIKIARADYMPTLSFSAGLGTNYYKTSGFDADGFGKQLKNNFSQYLGLNLSIPVFNHFSTRNKIRTAKIDRENQELKLEDTKKTLYKEIQQVYYNAVASEAKFTSSQQAVMSNSDAFALMKAKYENGKANITEFNEQKNNLLKSESDMVQAKYEYLYNSALIDFYRGRNLSF